MCKGGHDAGWGKGEGKGKWDGETGGEGEGNGRGNGRHLLYDSVSPHPRLRCHLQAACTTRTAVVNLPRAPGIVLLFCQFQPAATAHACGFDTPTRPWLGGGPHLFVTTLTASSASLSPPRHTAHRRPCSQTEKLLLFGGAIHEAGEVKARRSAKSATSDWMALEKQR